MKNKKTGDQPLFFSMDPEENLKIENQILHLKLKAELGGELMGTDPLPPNLENTFLKNILELEHAYANSSQVKIFDLLGKPSFPTINDLNDDEITLVLQEIDLLLRQKQIVLEFSGTYDPRLRYRFITEEFFEHQTDGLQIDGLVTYYIYEEFHPDHRSDIESRVTAFIESWMQQEIDENTMELGDAIILPDATVYPKESVLPKIHEVFASHQSFSESCYSIDNISFELNENDETGAGLAQGFITYTALTAQGNKVKFGGSFEFKLVMEYKCWSISYFILPGFTW